MRSFSRQRSWSDRRASHEAALFLCRLSPAPYHEPFPGCPDGYEADDLLSQNELFNDVRLGLQFFPQALIGRR